MSFLDVLNQIVAASNAPKPVEVVEERRAKSNYRPAVIKSARVRTERSDLKFLKAIPDKGASTSQIGIAMGTYPQGVLKRLKEMEGRGLLTCEKLTGYGVKKMDVWKKTEMAKVMEVVCDDQPAE